MRKISQKIAQRKFFTDIYAYTKNHTKKFPLRKIPTHNKPRHCDYFYKEGIDFIGQRNCRIIHEGDFIYVLTF